jgi:hypothetical protein
MTDDELASWTLHGRTLGARFMISTPKTTKPILVDELSLGSAF